MFNEWKSDAKQRGIFASLISSPKIILSEK